MDNLSKYTRYHKGSGFLSLATLFSCLVLVTAITSVDVQASNEHFSNDVRIESESNVDSVYTVVDQMPEIDGGIKAIYKNIKYPQAALSSGVEGRVFIKFIVNEQGKVESPEILKDIGGGCGKAAIEGLKKVKFTPGKLKGKAVKVYYTLPISFEIKG
ncbi:MAG: energy transducer TonB [Balneolaceae bacterium]|nr:energy transducer TonB [Balneolaceae bacterium]